MKTRVTFGYFVNDCKSDLKLISSFNTSFGFNLPSIKALINLSDFD